MINRECQSPKQKLPLDTDPKKHQKRNNFVINSISDKGNISERKQTNNTETTEIPKRRLLCSAIIKLQAKIIPSKTWKRLI